MNDTETTRGTRSRRARIALPFAVGALAGAGVIAGAVAITADDEPASEQRAAATATATTAVARTATTLSAEEIYAQDAAGVVEVKVTGSAQQGGVSPFGPGGGQAQGEGTGFVYDRKGHVITAAHVVDGASQISVRFSDGAVVKATLVGTDPSTDTAVIKVDVAASRLKPLDLGDSARVRPGQGVVAIGSPFGLEHSITAGIVSAVDRSIEAPNGYSIPSTIQTDAPINHGNSGGPLIDARGDVIGVNVQIAVGEQGGASQNAGVGFAVPSNTVKQVVADMIAGRSVEHAYLGVSVGDNTTGAGAQIGAVKPGSPAGKAGLRAGDVVTALDGKAIAEAAELTAAVAAHRPGDEVTVKVTRNGKSITLTVTLGSRPATTA